MPQVSLDFNYSTSSDLVISVAQLKERYFMGIPIVSPDGTLMSDEDISFYIKAAQTEIETMLDIKLGRQIITETKDFLQDHYRNWSYIKATYPVKCIHQIDGFVGTTRQVKYPESWFSIHRTNDDIVHRTINIVPTNQGSITDQSVVYSGIYPQLGYYGSRQIPNYWTITYTTGFEKVPGDILKAVGMMSAMPIFDLLGDLIIGAGIASQSLGLDGLSQSVSTTSSAENSGYSSRIKSYQGQMKIMLPNLEKRYRGLIFSAV